MRTVAFYDTKPYDRDYFQRTEHANDLAWRFHEFRLNAATAASASGARSVCVFVNDRVDRACLKLLVELGVRHVALRCAGFNNVDLVAARELGLAVTRVPAYSPHAVAEHTLALLLALNRKVHRAYNRVRELNFSLNGLVGFDLHGKTAGVVGTGKIGRLTAGILRGFGMNVLAYDPFPSPDWACDAGVTYTDFDTLLGASDVVTLHLPHPAIAPSHQRRVHRPYAAGRGAGQHEPGQAGGHHRRDRGAQERPARRGGAGCV